MTALDQDKDGTLSREEFTQGFARWYQAWTKDSSDGLTEDRLRVGMNKELPVFPPGGGPGFPGGPPRGAR